MHRKWTLSWNTTSYESSRYPSSFQFQIWRINSSLPPMRLPNHREAVRCRSFSARKYRFHYYHLHQKWMLVLGTTSFLCKAAVHGLFYSDNWRFSLDSIGSGRPCEATFERISRGKTMRWRRRWVSCPFFGYGCSLYTAVHVAATAVPESTQRDRQGH